MEVLMRTFVFVVWVVLVLLSVVARVMIRRKKENRPVVEAVLGADMIFFIVGFILVGLANASLTNQLAKYEEGFPNVDMGGLPPMLFFGNLLFFFTPLMVVGPRHIFKGTFKEFRFLLTGVQQEK